jgi:hypothetical protein
MCQVIDDEAGSTLVAASSLTPEIREKLGGPGAGGNQVSRMPSLLTHTMVCSQHDLKNPPRGPRGLR